MAIYTNLGLLTAIYWRIRCSAVRTLDRLPQSSRMLDRRHIPARSMHASLLHFSQRTPQNPTFPVFHFESKRAECEKNATVIWADMRIRTGSPPDANEIFGISCDAMTSLFSRLISDNNLLDTRNVTFVPAFSISGLSDNACWIRLSQRRFFDVFRPAASHTRFMHSFATCDRNVKSNDFIDVFISKHPMYWNGNSIRIFISIQIKRICV